jgi:hypothetical protein
MRSSAQGAARHAGWLPLGRRLFGVWSKPDASIALHDVLLLNAGYPKTSANISMRLPVRSRVASMMLRS